MRPLLTTLFSSITVLSSPFRRCLQGRSTLNVVIQRRAMSESTAAAEVVTHSAPVNSRSKVRQYRCIILWNKIVVKFDRDFVGLRRCACTSDSWQVHRHWGPSRSEVSGCGSGVCDRQRTRWGPYSGHLTIIHSLLMIAGILIGLTWLDLIVDPPSNRAVLDLCSRHSPYLLPAAGTV